MSRYLDWRLDELYPVERGATTTKRTGQASRKAIHEPGPVDKWWSGRDQRASEFRERGKASVEEMRQQWMGTRGPLTAAWDFVKTDEIKGRGRQRREPFKPGPWSKHPANPDTQLSEAQRPEINSTPINVQPKEKNKPNIQEGVPIDPQPNSPDSNKTVTPETKNKDEQTERETGKPKQWKDMSNAEKVSVGSKAALDISKAIFGDQTKIKTHSIQNRFLDHDWMLGSGYVG